MSATLTSDVTTLKALILRNPAILTLTDEDHDNADNATAGTIQRKNGEGREDSVNPKLLQYVIHVKSDSEKFLHIYVILKLKLIKGKAIIFVNDLERCYRLKLFLEQFSIRSCVLNRELPINSR